MEKVIITATVANSWIYPELKNWAVDNKGLIKDAIQCAEAGAAIIHIHLPRSKEATEIVAQIREQSDVIIQAGMSSYPIEQRITDFESRPDMLSVILNHHAEVFTNVQVDQLHTLNELELYAEKSRRYKIKLEFEVWHTGSYWNLNYLINKNLLDPPYYLTLFFGWPGGTWCPPTIDSFLYLKKYMPKDSVYSVSIMGKEQRQILPLAILNGGNIRVGTEDNPFIKENVPAKNNAEIVKDAINLCRALGREIADPSEARKIIKI